MMKANQFKLLVILSILFTALFTAATQDLRAQGSVQVQILGVPGVLDSPSLAEQINRFDNGQYPIQFVYTAPTNQEETFRFLFTLEKDGRRLAEVESDPVTFRPGFYLYNNFQDEPQITFSETLNQVISSLPRADRSIFNSGLFPEGNYMLTIEAVPEDRFSMISTLPGMAQFTVSYGQPPLLISPAEGSEVIQPFPIFTWAPVTAPADVNIEYEIRIVELLRGQQPEQAIDGARFPIVEEVVQNLTSFVMTQEQLQFEPGTVYAWQVTARDAFGEYPFRDGGRSEIGIFTYSGLPGEGESLADLQEVVLIPGFARLTNFVISQTEADDFSYTLDGFATLHIGNPTTVPIEFSQLRIQKTGLDNPVVLGGNVNGSVQEAVLPFGQASSIVEFLDISWTFGEAFHLSGDILLPGEDAVASSGSISWTPQGLQGELTADAPDGLKIGKNPVEADLASVTASFPETTISASGSLALFGESADCQIGTISIGHDGATMAIDCDLDKEIPLNEGHDLVELKGKRVVGNLSSDTDGETAFNLSLSADLNLNLFTGPDCSSSMQLGINNEDGVSVQSFNSSCLTNPSLNLGIGTLQIRNLETPEISYSEAEGWGYRIPWNQDLAFQFERRQSEMSDPSQPGQEQEDDPVSPGDDPTQPGEGDPSDTAQPGDDSAQPGDDPTDPGDGPAQPGGEPGQQPDDTFEDDDVDETTPPEPGREPIRMPTDDPSDQPADDDETDAVSDEGLEFKEREYDENQLRNSEGCISGFFVQPKRFHLPDFVLPWADYLPASTTVEFPLEFFFDAELRLGCTTVKPRVEIPECLENLGIEVTDASYSNGALNAEITTTELPDEGCFTSFGPGFVGGEEYGLKLKQIGGSISGSAGINGFEQQGKVWVETALMAGSPFNCNENRGSTELLTGELNVRSDGVFEGELSGNVECPLEFGGFSLSLTDATVNFRAGEKGQRAKLTGTAELEYEDKNGQTLISRGNVEINLVTGEIEKLELLIEGPFVWGFPQENPFMEFELEQAILNRQGLQVDGTHSLMIKEESVDVVFDELLVGFDGRIKSGKISTVPSVALAGGLGSSEMAGSPVSIDFGLRLPDEAVPEDLAAGFLINLESPIVVDSAGISLDGSAEALLRFGAYTPPPLTASMEQFTLAFNSPVIAGGQIELFLNASRVAWIDAEGFHPAWGWIEELIPDRLMLPTEEIAWLDLKNEEGEFIVDYETNEEGLIELTTKENMSLVFGAPVLEGLNVETPQWEVTLENVAIEQGTYLLKNGVIRAGIPQGSVPIDLTPMGIPLAVNEFRFERVMAGDSPVTRLYASGEISLFGQHFGETALAEVWFDGAGTASGAINIEDVDIRIPLIPDMGLVHIRLENLSIGVNVAPGTTDFSGINIGINGAMEVNLGDETAYSVPMDATWNNGGNFILNLDYEEALSNLETRLDFNFGYLRAEELNSVWLEYSPDTGFDFEMELDLRLGFSSEETGIDFDLPFRSIFISPEEIMIPHIDISSLNIPALQIANASVRPVAFRTESPVSIQLAQNWYNSLFEALDPQIDLEIKLPQFSQNTGSGYQALSQAGLSVYGAGWNNGILTGEIEQYTFGANAQGLQIPVGQTGTSLMLRTASGYLDEVDGAQVFSVMLDTDVVGLPGFETDDEDCIPSALLEVASGRYLSGEITNFTPCGTMELGPLGLQIANSSLSFDVSENGEQELILSGSPTLLLPPLQEDASPVSVTGESLSVDLINMAILSGEVVVESDFRWALPRFENPFIDMRVTDATLDSEGFTISGNAELNISEQINSPQILLNEMRFGFEEFAIESGSLTLLSEAALEVGLFGEGIWRLVPPPNETTEVPGVPHFSMTLPEQVTLDANGLTVSGVSSGRLNIGEFAGEGEDSLFPEIDLHLVDDSEGNSFRVELNPPGYSMPARLAGGQIDFILDNQRLAYYSATEGFRLDNLVAAFDVPKKLSLPDIDIAYLILKDEEENKLVQTEEADGGGWVVSGTDVDLVLAALGDENSDAPVFSIDFSLTVDDSYSTITSGEIEVILEDGFDLEPYSNLPIELTGIQFSQGSGYQLGGSAKIRLPEALTDELGLEEIVIDELLFTENGFQQATISTGNYQDSYDADEEFTEYEISPVDNFGFYGAEVQFGETNSARFSGFFDMEVMANGGQRNPVLFKTEWSAGEGEWDVLIGIEQDTDIDLGLARLNVTELGGAITYQTNEHEAGSFSVFISGALAFEEMLGNDFKLAVEKLTFGIGTDKPVDVESVTLSGSHDACKDASEDPHILLFEGALKGCLDWASAEITENNAMRISIGGDLILFDHPMRFDTLTVGTDLYFAIDADLLPEEEKIELFEDLAYIEQLSIGWESGSKSLNLEGGMALNLPQPVSGHIESELQLVQVDGNVENALVDISYFFDDESEINEIDVGDLFQFRVDGIGAKIDFLNFGKGTGDQSIFFGYAELFLEKESDGTFNPDSRVRFGDPANNQYGFSYASLSENLEFNVIVDSLSADIGFFSFTFGNISTIDIEDSPFALDLSGSLSLMLDGVEGKVHYSAFQIKVPPAGELNPVHQWPVFEAASLTIMDLLSLSLGTYDYQVGGTVELAHGDDPDEIEYETIPVNRYLRFYNAIEGESALELTVDGLFSGGVEEVLFYQRSDNNAMRMLIQNANLSIDAGEDLVSLSLTLNYETDGAGGFALLAAGSGQFAGNGFAAVGNFSTLGGVTRMGLFIAATFTPAVPLIPQAPPVIGISGFGGGFFWKPETQTVAEVFNQAGHLGLDDEGVQGPPQTDDNTLFAAFLFGQFDMLGQGGFYAMRGTMLLTVTNQLMQINASGALLMQDAYLKANLSTQLAWSATTVELSGAVYAEITYPFLNGDGTISYSVVANIPAQTINWVLDGSYNADVMGFISYGQFSVAPSGFFADMTVEADLDIPVISLNGNLFAKVWMIPNLSSPLDSELGALAELTIEVSKWGHNLAGMEASLAYTQQSLEEYSVLGYGALYVDFFVFTGNLYGVIEIDCKGCGLYPTVDGSVTTEIDGALVDLVNDAKTQADSAENAIEDALAGVNEAQQNAVFDPTISEEDLIAAGTALQYFGPGQALPLVTAFGYRQDQAVYAKTNMGDFPVSLNFVRENIVGEPGKPSFQAVESAQVEAEERLSSVQTVSGRVISRLNEATILALEAVEESELALVELVNPVSEEPQAMSDNFGDFTVSSQAPFSVNTGLLESAMEAAMQNVQQLDNQEEIEAQNQIYRDAIYAAAFNLMEVDEIIEEELLELGQMYGEAVSAMQKMYAEHISYFWRNKQRFEHLKSDLNLWEEDIYLDIEDIIEITTNSLVHSMCEDLIYYEMEVPQFSGDQLNQLEDSHMCLGVMVDLIAQKRALIYHLADYMAEGEWQEDLISRQADQRDVFYEQHVEGIIGIITNPFTLSFNNELSLSDNASFETELSQFVDDVESTMKDFWFNQHNDALNDLAITQANNISDLKSIAQERLNALDEAYADYSQRLETLFLLKTQMTETLYVMLDSYSIFVQQNELELDQTFSPSEERLVDWQNPESSSRDSRDNDLEESPEWTYSELRQEIESWLQPPVITNFSVNSERPDIPYSIGVNPPAPYHKFMSRNKVEWNLIPDDSELLGLTELGITTSGNAQSALRALGKNNSYTFYGWKENEDDHDREYNVALRVRSRGGIAVSQSGTVETRHSSSEDEYGSLTHGQGSTISDIGDELQAPEMHSFEILNAELIEGYRYSSDTDRLTIQTFGLTHYSEIARFEYVISASDSPENPKYSSLSGVRNTSPSAISVTGTVEGLNLEPGTYWVFVRAVGSGGQHSEPSVRQLVIDPDTPQFTGSVPDNTPAHSVRNASHGVSGSVVSGVPTAGNPAFVPVEGVNPSDYTRNISWRQVETGPSGLKQYEAVVSDSETPTSAMFSSDSAIHTNSTHRRIDLPFGRSYLHVRVLSKAGLYSETETYVLEHPDPTPPSIPNVKLQSRNNGFRIYLPQQSKDPETGIAGYQYRITNMSNMQTLKDWPEGTDDNTGNVTVDFTPGQLTTGSQGAAPYHTVYNHQLGLDVDQSYQLRVELRAVNGDDNYSGIVRTDITLQPAGNPELSNWVVGKTDGQVSTTQQGPAGIPFIMLVDGVIITANISGASDAVSGIQTLRLVIRDAINNEILFDQYHTPGSDSGQLPNTANHQFSYGSASLANRGSVDVTLTIENGQGVSKSWNESVLINEEVVNNTPAPRLEPRVHYRDDLSISQVDFYWDDGEHPYVDRYSLYRGSGETGPDEFTQVSTALPIREQPYILVNPAEREHFFLTAQNQFGVETPLEEVNIWVADPEAGVTGMITDFHYSDIVMTGTATAVALLRWESSGDVEGYAIFRVGSDGRHNHLRSLPQGTRLMEIEVATASTYVIKAITANGNYGPPGEFLEINPELYSEASP